jgi:hypothetical protein
LDGNHYPRSWLLLGLNQFGSIVDADTTPTPYGHSRRLITHGDVNNDPTKAHGYVQPNKSSPKDAKGNYIQDEVWKYLFTSDVNQVGAAVPAEPSTPMDLRKIIFSHRTCFSINFKDVHTYFKMSVRIDLITLFPAMADGFLQESVIGRSHRNRVDSIQSPQLKRLVQR